MMDLSESIWNLALQSLKTYLHYHIAYVQKIWQMGELPYREPTDKVRWPFSMWSCEIMWQTKTISCLLVSMAFKLGGMVTQLVIEDLSESKSCKTTWQTKTIISQPPESQCAWPPNMTRWWLIKSSSHP